VLETPIFHPNFGSYICIGDFWAAGETLTDIIIKIGQMIMYQDLQPQESAQRGRRRAGPSKTPACCR